MLGGADLSGELDIIDLTDEASPVRLTTCVPPFTRRPDEDADVEKKRVLAAEGVQGPPQKRRKTGEGLPEVLAPMEDILMDGAATPVEKDESSPSGRSLTALPSLESGEIREEPACVSEEVAESTVSAAPSSAATPQTAEPPQSPLSSAAPSSPPPVEQASQALVPPAQLVQPSPPVPTRPLSRTSQPIASLASGSGAQPESCTKPAQDTQASSPIFGSTPPTSEAESVARAQPSPSAQSLPAVDLSPFAARVGPLKRPNQFSQPGPSKVSLPSPFAKPAQTASPASLSYPKPATLSKPPVAAQLPEPAAPPPPIVAQPSHPVLQASLTNLSLPSTSNAVQLPAAVPEAPPPKKKGRLSVAHVPLMYDIKNGKMICRMCRYVSRTHRIAPAPSLTHAPRVFRSARVERACAGATSTVLDEASATWHQIVGHAEAQHPASVERLVTMSQEEIRLSRQSFEARSAATLLKKARAAGA